jgi:Zn-finger nucleic acid-binding protein
MTTCPICGAEMGKSHTSPDICPDCPTFPDPYDP